MSEKQTNNSLGYFRRYLEIKLSTTVDSNITVMYNEPMVLDARGRVGADWVVGNDEV